MTTFAGLAVGAGVGATDGLVSATDGEGSTVLGDGATALAEGDGWALAAVLGDGRAVHDVIRTGGQTGDDGHCCDDRDPPGCELHDRVHRTPGSRDPCP